MNFSYQIPDTVLKNHDIHTLTELRFKSTWYESPYHAVIVFYSEPCFDLTNHKCVFKELVLAETHFLIYNMLNDIDSTVWYSNAYNYLEEKIIKLDELKLTQNSA